MSRLIHLVFCLLVHNSQWDLVLHRYGTYLCLRRPERAELWAPFLVGFQLFLIVRLLVKVENETLHGIKSLFLLSLEESMQNDAQPALQLKNSVKNVELAQVGSLAAEAKRHQLVSISHL